MGCVGGKTVGDPDRERFVEVVLKNPVNRAVLERGPQLGVRSRPREWCMTTTTSTVD